MGVWTAESADVLIFNGRNDHPNPQLIHCFALTPSEIELLTKNDFCAVTSS